VIDLEPSTSARQLADWVELSVLTGLTSMSRSELGTLVEQASGSEPPDDLISSVYATLAEEQGRFDASPFQVEKDLVLRAEGWRWRDFPEYVACVYWSYFGNADTPAAAGKLFERIVAHACKQYLGHAVVFGWPDVPGASFPDRVNAVADILGERRSDALARLHHKDRGVDVVSWAEFHDRLPNKLTVLLQCAAGHDWKGKTRAVPVKAWRDYIQWGVDPTEGFAIPQAIQLSELQDISSEAGLVVDRPRIYNLLRSGPPDVELREALVAWLLANGRLDD